MKLCTSYFYRIRFFRPDIVPFSTAKWDPKWYHNFQGQNNIFLDRNGVLTKSDLKVDKVFQQEHEHAKILLEDYAQTNAREYFACAIEEYFLNEEERHIFEQELPLTYALVEDILLNYA